jgi:serine/threonine-protein kinase HipA
MPEISSLAVWVSDRQAGLLTRDEMRTEYVFAYAQDAGSDAQVSLTMPVRLASWTSRELHPIFQMNLPEGALLEAIRRPLQK